jgi:hypothetical protein
MIEFKIPLKGLRFFKFSLESEQLMFAGSRHLEVEAQTARDLVKAFGSLGFSFMTGCANGVDASFRKALSESRYEEQTVIACAFKKRLKEIKGLLSLFVVPDNLPPRAALAKRTLWMTSRCSLLVLFPTDPIGKGSLLAFKSAIFNSKPVFVVSKTKPNDSDLYSIYHSNLFGIVDGWWCIPPVYQKTGLCIEAV